MATIPLYKSSVFSDEILNSLSTLKESITEPTQSVDYTTDRFDSELAEAQIQSSNGDYEESNKTAISYFDKAFVDGCPSLWLISNNYWLLWNKELSRAYKDAERFCQLIRLPELESEMSELHKSIQKHTIVYPNELVFHVFDLYFRSIFKTEVSTPKEQFKDSLSYGYIRTITEIRSKEYLKHSLDYYDDLLEYDFVPKSALLTTLGTRYDRIDLIEKALNYEDIVRNRWIFRSNYHNVFHNLAKIESTSENDQMFYFLSSLEFDSSRVEEYKERMIELFFSLELFRNTENITALSSIFPKLNTAFFTSLNALYSWSLDEFEGISQSIVSYNIENKDTVIKKEKLIPYLYTFIDKKEAREICEGLKKISLVDDFTKHIENFIVCEEISQIQESVEKVLEENAILEESNLSSKTTQKTKGLMDGVNIPDRHTIVFILSVIIFMMIFAFIAFVVIKKK